jgi:hypothetical protein
MTSRPLSGPHDFVILYQQLLNIQSFESTSATSPANTPLSFSSNPPSPPQPQLQLSIQTPASYPTCLQTEPLSLLTTPPQQQNAWKPAPIQVSGLVGGEGSRIPGKEVWPDDFVLAEFNTELESMLCSLLV